MLTSRVISLQKKGGAIVVNAITSKRPMGFGVENTLIKAQLRKNQPGFAARDHCQAYGHLPETRCVDKKPGRQLAYYRYRDQRATQLPDMQRMSVLSPWMTRIK